jgi:hypothetical protein
MWRELLCATACVRKKKSGFHSQHVWDADGRGWAAGECPGGGEGYVGVCKGKGWDGMGCVRRVVVLHFPLFIRRDDPVIFSVMVCAW